MRILAFDCAGAQCAAAVGVGGETIAERRIESDRGHAQLLMPLLASLAEEAGMAFSDFDRFAVTTGPGSFTGIRVALATARGLALGTGRPVVGINVFDVIAADAAQSGFPAPRLLVAVESRRSECFFQLFDRAGKPAGEPAMLTPEAIQNWVGAGPVAIAGDAAEKVAAVLPEAIDLGPRFHAAAPGALARLAAERPQSEAPPKPFYLHPPDAIPAATRATGGRAPHGNFATQPLTPAMAEVAAALHATAGLTESWDARAFADLLGAFGTEGRLAVDHETGEPVGLALWRVVVDEAELLTICVPPERRRRGAGRFLLAEALAAAAGRGARRMALEVAVDNLPATALYRAFGFAPGGRRSGYYRTESGAVDAEILVLEDLRSAQEPTVEPLFGRI